MCVNNSNNSGHSHRRIFKIPVKGVIYPKWWQFWKKIDATKAETTLKEIVSNYKEEINFDEESGEINYFLPKKNQTDMHLYQPFQPFKIYTLKDIQTVYSQHHYYCGTVLYSEDGGFTWHSVPMDSGKWDRHKWLFAFISIS